MSDIRLGGGAEFDRIRSIARALGAQAAGLGDDCAFIEMGGETLALSTDVSVEGVHFRRDWLTLEEIGWRAAAAALSDLAAVGATPIGVLAALTVPVPPRAAPETADALMIGVGGATAAAGGAVLGGDLSRGEAISIAVTVVGRARRVTRREGARPGDSLWLTGELGAARAALMAWRSGRVPDPAARTRFVKPTPRISEGRWLAGHGATAMLDLSDGLGGDAAHLAAASAVGIRVPLERLPVHAAVAAEARAAGEAAEVFAARGGEDYELLVAMPAEFSGTREFPLTRVGEVVGGSGVIFELEGRPIALTGYDHFA